MPSLIVIDDPATRRVVVRPSGELDVATGGRLRDALVEACRSGLNVVVDLSEVEFLDASTIGLLVASSRRLATGGHALSVAAARPRIRLVFYLTGLGNLLEVPRAW